jgi:DNA-binding transcriptional ArsR family regulator
MADLFDVIADPTRRDLLRALLVHAGDGTQSGEVSVGELVGELSLSQPTVSKHLKTLRDFSLVSVREQGQHRYYRLDPEQLRPIVEWLDAFLPTPVAVATALAAPADPGVADVGSAPIAALPAPLKSAATRIGAIAASLADRIPTRNR